MGIDGEKMHLLALNAWSTERICEILDLAADIKQAPEKYASVLKQRVLLMIFEKPSLRTRVSFETGMVQMGGHAIYYDTSKSPMGKGKETLADSIKVASRYVDLVMARLFEHSDLLEMAAHADIPVINALTDYSHPCQILADLQTVREKKGALKGLKLAYLGDGHNNVTHSLMFGGAKMGLHVRVASPPGEDYAPLPEVTEKASAIAAENGGSITLSDSPSDAVRDVDVVYTDSWMSYHIPEEQRAERMRILKPYQVNKDLMELADDEAIFMNCLPAMRGAEQTAEVIDGSRSVVFDEAENRLYAHKAVLLDLFRRWESAK